jgi:hypothetical protein
MKTAPILFACLLLSGVAPAFSPGSSSQGNDGLEAFADKFRTAVIKGDKETVIGLSGFPIRMPGRARSIKNAAELRVRYSEVFNKHISAAKCFREKSNDPNFAESKSSYVEGLRNVENPKLAGFNCGDNTGYIYDYVFALTATGWKFVRLDRFAFEG